MISARALRGGMSSAVYLLTVQDDSGQQRQVVLRRYGRREHNEQEPGAAGREARALRVACRAGVPVPALLAADPAGIAAGVPAILMSRLPGRVDRRPSDTKRWLRHLATVLPTIHATPLPPAGVLPYFAPYPQARYQQPGWARYPRVGASCRDHPEALARLSEALVHRDFHSGNVLWRRGAVSGVVDWQGACTGPAVADMAHCRVNLLGFGSGSMQRFTTLWEQAADAAYHPWGDIVTITGLLDDLRENRGSGRYLVEEMLARAVAEVGGHSR